MPRRDPAYPVFVKNNNSHDVDIGFNGHGQSGQGGRYGQKDE